MSCGRNPVGWRLSVAVPKHRPCAVRLIAVLCVQSPCFAQLPHRGTGLALCVRPSVRTSASAALTQTLLKGMQRLGPERISSAARRICSRFGPPQVACGRRPGTAPEQAATIVAPLLAPNSLQRPGSLGSLSSPHQATGFALCVRPSYRASASAVLTQALPQGLQRLGPEHISSAARARPPQVAPALCPGTAPEQVAPISAPFYGSRGTAGLVPAVTAPIAILGPSVCVLIILSEREGRMACKTRECGMN
jgi:hypothetical protein